MTDLSSSWVNSLSKYYHGLDVEAKKHYDVKLATLGSLETPMMLQTWRSRQIEWQHWPSIEYPDIYNYLISTSNLDTLEVYKYFVSGWVSNVTVHHVPPGNRADHLVMAHVKHSQKLSAPFLHPTSMNCSWMVRCSHLCPLYPHGWTGGLRHVCTSHSLVSNGSQH